VQEVKSSFGGFYQFAKVPLGKYTLRVSPKQVQRLNLKPPPDQKVILNADEPVLSGMDITMEPALKVGKESRAITPLESQQLANKPSTKKTTPQPESPSLKVKPLPPQKQYFPQKKLNTPLLSPSVIRQMGSSWGRYLNQPRTK